MRLGQLARKLSIPPSEVVAFLASKSLAIEGGHNARLEDLYVREIILHFSPARLNEIMTPDPDPVVEVEKPADLPVMEIEEKEPFEEVSEPEEIPEEPLQPVEVIKAPKMELPGLRVIGKIDLPESKKKEILTEPSENGSVKEVNRDPAQRKFQRPDKHELWRRQQSRKREQEEREEKERIELEEEQEKERRTQKYLKKVKSVPSKPVKRFEEQVVEVTNEPEEPKSVWGKFFRWLTT